ncbi:hypothetical protein VIA_002719 [Vibrio orientalis CIP 102891 = ATCC 33934]|uniref:Uncharacterized protein n=1 Tax=Vibrio orientalis CIP 102891 = ATCC 33934 TaxID=675816 RepID=A0ABP2GVH6_VIBOR|nr:hypothetical protein VIA_002719 [Vibrio orientalis CIP 102891 = ATCC 33934]
MIPNAWHFSFHRWVLCLRWYGLVLWSRCSHLNAALGFLQGVVSLSHRYTKGYEFLFSLPGYEVLASGSALAGKEVIKVNGEVCSEKYSFGLNSTHMFEVNDEEFVVDFKVVSWVKGLVACRLTIDGKLVAILQANPQYSYGLFCLFFIFQFVGSILLFEHMLPLLAYNFVLMVVFSKFCFRNVQVRELKT